MHDWPAWLNAATAVFSAAVRQSPSAATMSGELEPSSSRTFARGAFATIAQPTSGLPVNETYATPGCRTSASPTDDPPPGTTLSQPRGTPRSCSSDASSNADIGVCVAGLRTTGQPAAIAGASLCATRFNGKLNGEIAATTPIGTR